MVLYEEIPSIFPPVMHEALNTSCSLLVIKILMITEQIPFSITVPRFDDPGLASG